MLTRRDHNADPGVQNFNAMAEHEAKKPKLDSNPEAWETAKSRLIKIINSIIKVVLVNLIDKTFMMLTFLCIFYIQL